MVVRPGAIRTGIEPRERNSRFLSLDRSSQLEVRPNLKRTAIDAWARGKVEKILPWCMLEGPEFKALCMMNATFWKVVAL